ncbi:MAG: hypothetical protein SGI77_12890 [Pirellulaceae bacterium]|nr:hypothetical protein [Pirellulaceae bacterium]
MDGPLLPIVKFELYQPRTALWGLLLILLSGCGQHGLFQIPEGKGRIAIPSFIPPKPSIPRVPLDGSVPVNNPVPLAEQDPEFLWLQIVDTVDDYFRIKTEQRFRRDSEQWLEGNIETYPEIGATKLEPWRKDAVKGFQRWQSTFQTIRRTAYIRVTPMATGYSMSIEVMKELEDVDRSVSSGEGSASVRHDGGIVRSDNQLTGLPITLGWIRQENDTELEQKILREVLGRVTEVRPPRKKLLHPNG